MIELNDLHVVAHGIRVGDSRLLDNAPVTVTADELPALLLRTVHRHAGWRTSPQWSCQISIDHGRRARNGDVRDLLNRWHRRGILERTGFLREDGRTGVAYRFARTS